MYASPIIWAYSFGENGKKHERTLIGKCNKRNSTMNSVFEMKAEKGLLCLTNNDEQFFVEAY